MYSRSFWNNLNFNDILTVELFKRSKKYKLTSHIFYVYTRAENYYSNIFYKAIQSDS